jgi:acyl-coenzyme A synthetase/AMP-(fatty) acid ligase
MYGQTECKRVCFLPPEQLDARPGSVGVAIPGTQAWVDAPPGEVGELLVRGEHVMQGYWRDPEATAKKLVGDGVLRSGDLFRADEEGYLYVEGRRDDQIKSRGEKVMPREVEDALLSHEAVHEAAVVGVPDRLLGQAIHAHVVLAPGAEAKVPELRRHCAERLEVHKVPKQVVIRDALPRTINGKLDRKALAAEAG